MRVLHLTTEFPPIIYGGLGTAVGGWVNASARAGLAVAVLLVEGRLDVDGPGYGGYGYGQPGPAARDRPLGRREVASREGVRFVETTWERGIEDGVALARRFRPDVVHLHTAMLWPLARGLVERTGTALVYHVHSVDRAEYEVGREPSPWLVHTAQEEAIAAADRLIAISRSELELLERYYPEAASRIRLVGNGIDDSALARRCRRRDSTGAPLVLYSGRLVERKGIRDLLAAIPRVLARHPATRFVLAGGPPGCAGEDLERWWMSAELAPFAAQVRFTGWLAPDALAQWYARADVLAVPSRYEPFGMVILEGMLYGLPIVAADVGGPAEILRHGRTGLLVPACDAAALAGALARLVASAGLRRRLGRAAWREVRSRWLWPRRVREMRTVYEELAADAARSAPRAPVDLHS